MGGGGGKSQSASAAPAPAQAEAPKPHLQEREMDNAAQQARDAQLKRARAALGQEGSVLTSPFGSQQQTEEQRKSLLGG